MGGSPNRRASLTRITIKAFKIAGFWRAARCCSVANLRVASPAAHLDCNDGASERDDVTQHVVAVHEQRQSVAEVAQSELPGEQGDRQRQQRVQGCRLQPAQPLLQRHCCQHKPHIP